MYRELPRVEGASDLAVHDPQAIAHVRHVQAAQQLAAQQRAIDLLHHVEEHEHVAGPVVRAAGDRPLVLAHAVRATFARTSQRVPHQRRQRRPQLLDARDAVERLARLVHLGKPPARPLVHRARSHEIRVLSCHFGLSLEYRFSSALGSARADMPPDWQEVASLSSVGRGQYATCGGGSQARHDVRRLDTCKSCYSMRTNVQ